MKMFLIMAVVFGVSIGVLFGLLFTSRMSGWKCVWGMIATMVITGCVISGAFCLNQLAQNRVWNDGVCTECGDSWEFANVSKNKNTTTYFWYCDECGVIIEQSCQR